MNRNLSEMESMMKHRIYAALLAGLVIAPIAQASEYTAIQADKSTLNFTYKQMGVAMDGNFKKFNAQISFDPAKPANAKAAFDLELASIDTGSEEADDEVKGKNWFNTKVFPRARFESTNFKPLGSNRYEVSGKTTFKEEFVTAGGIALAEIDVKSMQSKLVSGMFFAGEVLDIDGITGGFNFQAAWTTGFVAGKNVGIED